MNPQSSKEQPAWFIEEISFDFKQFTRNAEALQLTLARATDILALDNRNLGLHLQQEKLTHGLSGIRDHLFNTEH